MCNVLVSDYWKSTSESYDHVAGAGYKFAVLTYVYGVGVWFGLC